MGLAFFIAHATDEVTPMPTPPPEVTQAELEELYSAICRARENFLEAKEKCFHLFCLARRRECYLKSKSKLQDAMKKKNAKSSKRSA